MAILSQLERQLLGQRSSWNHEPRVIFPEKPGIRRSAILVHGFMGSPFDMKPLGQALARQGFRVVIPVLSGQTWTTAPLDRKNFSAEFYLAWLRELVERETTLHRRRPVMVGFSMGGALATIVAARPVVKKLALLAPFYKLPGVDDWIWKVSRKMARVLPVVPKISKGRINSRKGYERYLPGACLVSLGAFNHLGDLALAARKAAARIDMPVQVYFSDEDQVADAAMTRELFENRPGITLYPMAGANHILCYDHGAETMIQGVSRFFIRDETR